MDTRSHRVLKKVAHRAKSYDFFGQPITLNVDGDETVTTYPGLLLSILVTGLIIAFAIK